MTDRDLTEEGSAFWNEGKWNNFIAPFLPQDGKGQTLVDMGCNAGLFLKLAEDRGFKAIGVDSNAEAVKKGIEWRDKIGSEYRMILSPMEACIDDLPVVDWTILCNAHYYFKVDAWLEYLDKLKFKTRWCIVVTDEKKFINRCWAATSVEGIRRYFKDWKEGGFIDLIQVDKDPRPRKLRSLCFESQSIEKVRVDGLDSSNHVQDKFYAELDRGKEYKGTRYYRVLKGYRSKWTENYLNRWVERKVQLYESVKADGLKKALIVDDQNRVLDGNHRYSMLCNLGHEEVFVRRV
jgi:hypothetical protein